MSNGTLEVRTKLDNLSTDPMPVAIGFHPYFQVNDAPRDEWTFGLAARTEWVLTQDKIPTGETRPIEQFLPKPQGSTLKGLSLDHVFGDLIRDGSGKATMWVQGKTERIEVAFGPNYKSVVVYSPGGPGHDFICFEPMTGITDALNLAQQGLYKELQYIPPGQDLAGEFLGKAERDIRESGGGLVVGGRTGIVKVRRRVWMLVRCSPGSHGAEPAGPGGCSPAGRGGGAGGRGGRGGGRGGRGGTPASFWDSDRRPMKPPPRRASRSTNRTAQPATAKRPAARRGRTWCAPWWCCTTKRAKRSDR